MIDNEDTHVEDNLPNAHTADVTCGRWVSRLCVLLC